MDAPDTLKAKKVEKIVCIPTWGNVVLPLNSCSEGQFFMNFNFYRNSYSKLISLNVGNKRHRCKGRGYSGPKL